MNTASVETFRMNDFGTIRANIIETMTNNKGIPQTYYEIANKSGLTPLQTSRRLSELLRDGLIKSTGLRRQGKRSRNLFILANESEIENLKRLQRIEDFNDWRSESLKFKDLISPDVYLWLNKDSIFR